MALNQVVVNGETLLDLTADTVSENNLLLGATAHNAAGEPIMGAVGVATQSANGLMSAADKAKLDGIEENANHTVVDSELSDTSENPVQNKIVKKAIDEKGTYSKPLNGIPKSDLTTAVQTSLGKADTALQEHQSLSDYVKTTDSRLSDARTPKTHTHTKSEITDFPTIPTKTSQLTNDSGFKTTDTTYGVATQSANGLMSAADKAKLDGIEENANRTVVDSELTFNVNKSGR